MTKPRPIGPRELRLIEQFANCQVEMTPKEFYGKWAVTYAQMAQLCHCDIATVSRWFTRGRNERASRPYHRWYLGLADIMLESYEDIPTTLLNRLCLGQ